MKAIFHEGHILLNFVVETENDGGTQPVGDIRTLETIRTIY